MSADFANANQVDQGPIVSGDVSIDSSEFSITGAGRFSKRALEKLSKENAEVIRVTPDMWAEIAEDIIAIELSAFGQEGRFSNAQLQNGFCGPYSVGLVAKDNASGRVVGFTYAYTNHEPGPYVCNTAFIESHRGSGLVWPLMEDLDNCLREKGYTRAYRNARMGEGYDQKLIAFYGEDRIIDASRVIEIKPYGQLRVIHYSLEEK